MNTCVKREQEIINKVNSMGCSFTRRDMFNRYCKKIDAYLKLTNQPLSKESEYFEKYTEEEFDELLRKHYDIKEKNSRRFRSSGNGFMLLRFRQGCRIFPEQGCQPAREN